MDNETLKLRVLKAKKNLPKSGVTSLFFHYYGNAIKDTKENKTKLNNVLQTRSACEDFTTKLEKLAEILTNNNNK